MTVADAEVSEVILRVAAIVEESTRRYGIARDGRAVISQRVIAYALFDLDPAGYFAPDNRSDYSPAWRKLWRRSRRDGTRNSLNNLWDAVDRVFADHPPNEGSRNWRYTPQQIRDIAHGLTKESRTP